MNIPLIEINQPIGTFYIGALPAKTVTEIATVRSRNNEGGVQRELSTERVTEISKYCSDPDATFPTPIIIALFDDGDYILENNQLSFSENKFIGEIIDGQHRIRGISSSKSIDDFVLPVVFMFGLTEEEKAYVFSVINSKQTRVSMSLIYDLFDLSSERSPQKSCHEIARTLNNDPLSPFYRRLKMLGKKEGELSSLSQGTFIKYLLPLISKKPDEDRLAIRQKKQLRDDPSIPFRYYFINNKDENIYKVLENLFNALSTVFSTEWSDPEKYILSKTTGYGAVLRAFPHLYKKGMEKKKLSKEFFEECFENFKSLLQSEKKELTSKFFPSNEQQQKELSDIIVRSISDL